MPEKDLRIELNLLNEDVHSGDHAREIMYRQILFLYPGYHPKIQIPRNNKIKYLSTRLQRYYSKKKGEVATQAYVTTRSNGM